MNEAQPAPSAQDFYDDFGQKLLNDYVGGNPRMLAALEFTRQEISISKSKRVLDIGCGIGWSSHTLAKIGAVDEVVAIDLSPRLIDTAKSLFDHPKIRHKVVDITKVDSDGLGRFDVIVMLDVYEHIPATARENFHKALNSLLSDSGFLILSCPTIEHQNFLREHKPDGLQPVDEDVGYAELSELANDIGAVIDTFVVRSIWNSRDYLHCIVRRTGGTPPRRYQNRSWFSRTYARLRAYLFRRRIGKR